jgi:hypothetical protein
MRVANAQTLQTAKDVEKVKPEPVKKEVVVTPAPPPVVTTPLADGEDRTFKCEQEGCSSTFKSRSSLRDHQKGKKRSKFHEFR